MDESLQTASGTASTDANFDSRLRKHRLKVRRRQVEQQRATNESITTLLSVVQYLNRLQDGDGMRIDSNYDRTEYERRSRILNCHEEDIMNASLITMRRMIESLAAQSKRDPRFSAGSRASSSPSGEVGSHGAATGE